eukprot:COSAG01_NODE_225_length_21277_cov_71.340023_4_plen_98_part_00
MLCCGVRVRVDIMGSQKCRIVEKSQSLHIMINPIIFTRTRIVEGGSKPVGDQIGVDSPPAQASPPSIFRDKNRCDIGKSQSKWTAEVGNTWRTARSW